MTRVRSVAGGVAFVLLLFTVMLPPVTQFGGFVHAGPGSRLLEKDDWDVNASETVSSETVILNGDLVIRNGAVLKLVNVTLELNLSADMGHGISVQDKGRLELMDSTIRSRASGFSYPFNITDGALSTEGSTVQDFSTIRFTRSTGSINSTDLLDNNGTVIHIDRSDVQLDGGNIIVTGVASAGGAVIVDNGTMRSSSLLLKNLGDPSWTGIAAKGRSNLTTTGGSLYNFSVGISFEGKSLRVNGTKVAGATKDGLVQRSGTSVVSGAYFSDSLRSVNCSGGQMNLTSNNIKAGQVAVQLKDCNANVSGNTIGNSDIGIMAVHSQANITDNHIENNEIGLHWEDGLIAPIKGNLFENNAVGAYFVDATIPVTDCQFVGSSVDLRLNWSHITTLNTTFTKEIIDPVSTLSVDWYLSVFVRAGTGGPVPWASVEIKDQIGWTFTYETGQDGWIRGLTLRQRYSTRYDTTSHSPYTVIASNGSSQGQALVDLTGSGSVTVTIADVDLYYEDVNVSASTVRVGSPVYVNVTVASHSYPVFAVSLVLREDGNAYANRTFDLVSGPITAQFLYISDLPGTHRILFDLDFYQTVNESNETNNHASFDVKVLDASGGGGGLPDLEPIGISATGGGVSGGTVQITVEILNSGGTMAENVKVQLHIDGGLVGQHTSDHIAPGSSVRTVFTWKGTSGSHTVRVSIDPDNTINESNELNNVAETKVDIGSGDGFTNGLADQVMMICLGVIIILIVIIVVLLFAATRWNKKKDQQVQYYPPYQYGAAPPGPQPGQYPGYPAPPVGTPPPPTASSPTLTGALPGVSRVSGRAACRRCGSTKLKHLADGRRQCRDCKNIFL